MASLRFAALTALAAAACLAHAQDWPSRPIRIVTASPGGGVDFAARLMALKLSPVLGQPVVVENHGGSGIVAGDLVAKAAPDGHTLLFYGGGIWLLPFMRERMPFDPLRDLAPVSLTNSSPNVLIVNPKVPAKNFAEFIKRGMTNNRANLMFFLAVVMVGAMVWIVWKDQSINEYVKGIFTLVLGRFLGYLDNIYSFEFGTTRGSKEKDDTIKQLTGGQK